MFINNRYTRIYQTIVTRAQSRGLKKQVHKEYLEKHHIMPTAMGGSDDESNLVLLTAREHFLCHLLLTRMTEGKHLIRMRHAFSFMALCEAPDHQRIKVNSKWFEVARKMAAQKRDPEWGRNISAARKGQIPSAESIAKMRASLTGRKLTDEHRKQLSELGKLRTMTSQCREARKITLQKYYLVSHEGVKFEVLNLKEWCKERSFNYQTAHSNTRCKNPIRSGALQGYKFTACT